MEAVDSWRYAPLTLVHATDDDDDDDDEKYF